MLDVGKQRLVEDMLALQVLTYAEFQDHSSDKQKGVGAMTEAIIQSYGLLLKSVHKTIIEEENYLQCRKVLLERSGVLCPSKY